MSGTRNSNKLSIKCQCLRFIFIDEISMVSAGLLHALDKEVSRVVRQRGTYKMRSDDSEDVRPFGGINLVVLGDLWQIPPVGGNIICSNPLLAPSESVRKGLKLFWGDANCVQKLWELVQPMRCDDV